MRRMLGCLAAAALISVGSLSSAQAQITPVNTGAESELGIHMGGFMVYPTLDAGGAYNDNIFAANTGEKSDFLYNVRPGLDLESTWTHYLLSLKAAYDMNRYAKFSSQNTDNYYLSAATTIDASSDSQINASTEYDKLSELPGDTNVVTNAASPTTYFRWNSAADFKHVFNRLQLDVGGNYTTLRFHNTPAIGGGTIIEVLRDRDVSSAFLDLGYQLSPDYQFFTRGSWNQRDYRLSAGAFRDSSGYQIDAGFRAQITHLIEAQAYLGYLDQDYKTFGTFGGMDYGLKLNWSVTRLTTITADVARSIEETDQIGAANYFATTVSAGVTHALTRSVTLRAAVGYAKNDYRGVTRNEDIYSATFSADYQFTPHFHAVADYRYASRDSDIAGANYSQNVVEAKLRFSL